MFFYIHTVHKTLYNIQITYGVVCSKTMHIYMNIVKCMYNVHGMHCTMYNAYHAHIHRLHIHTCTYIKCTNSYFNRSLSFGNRVLKCL